MKKIRKLFYTIFFLLFICSNCAVTVKGVETPSKNKGSAHASTGYLRSDEIFDCSKLLPPPPQKGSAKLTLDEEISRDALKFYNTPRWEQAKRDANLSFPNIARIFECATDTPINEKITPGLSALMKRMLSDAGKVSDKAKNLYMRKRPFLINKKPICTPEYETEIGKSNAYPSGHTIIGWAWALVLSELVPERADIILARGRAFGESRIICNVHWLSDVIEGYMLGAALLSRLHGNSAFRSDLETVRAEVAYVRAKGLKPDGVCKSEIELLKY